MNHPFTWLNRLKEHIPEVRPVILTDGQILKEIEAGQIVIKPFRRDCLGTNSYDVHLGKYLAVYEKEALDAKAPNSIRHFEIPSEGFLFLPEEFYLGATEEYTETLMHVPFLEGKSSTGRLGIDIHATAGKGDIGFKNYWTLEISVRKPVRVYAGMPIGQLIYFMPHGEVLLPYDEKGSAKYITKSEKPMESKMWKNF